MSKRKEAWIERLREKDRVEQKAAEPPPDKPLAASILERIQAGDEYALDSTLEKVGRKPRGE